MISLIILYKTVGKVCSAKVIFYCHHSILLKKSEKCKCQHLFPFADSVYGGVNEEAIPGLHVLPGRAVITSKT